MGEPAADKTESFCVKMITATIIWVYVLNLPSFFFSPSPFLLLKGIFI